jgi:hypothetical protein
MCRPLLWDYLLLHQKANLFPRDAIVASGDIPAAGNVERNDKGVLT